MKRTPGFADLMDRCWLHGSRQAWRPPRASLQLVQSRKVFGRASLLRAHGSLRRLTSGHAPPIRSSRRQPASDVTKEKIVGACSSAQTRRLGGSHGNETRLGDTLGYRPGTPKPAFFRPDRELGQDTIINTL